MPDLIVPAAISSQLDESGEERIHIANLSPVFRQPWVPQIDDIYLSYSGSTAFRYTTDEADWANTVDTGGFVSGASVATRAHFVGGRLFRTGTSTPDRSRVTTDGVNFTSLTGSALSGAVETLLKPATEWLFFQSGSNVGVSTDGVDITNRALGGSLQDGRVAIKGSTILGMSTTANTARRSLDNGVTWGSVALGGATPSQGWTIATANRFLIFAQKTSDNTNFLKWSTTGAAASWTEVSLPGSFSGQFVRQGCYNPEINRVIIVMADYATYYSDDEGSTWTLGTPFPNLSGDFFSTTSYDFKFYNHKCYLRVNAASSLEHRLYTTVDGTSWTQIFNELTDGDEGVFLNFTAGDF